MKPSDVIPESGEREFGYADGGLTVVGISMLLGGLLVFALGVALAVTEMRHPTLIRGLEAWQALLFASLIAATGAAILTIGNAYLLSVRNEKIILTPDDIVWIDRKGVERIRCSFSQVRSAKARIWINSASDGSFTTKRHFRCIVETELGRIVFTDYISDYDRLKVFFVAQGDKGA